MRAAIYTRISEDRYGEAEGVERQKKSCEKLAKQRGLDVVAYFEDNNRSAMHGKRPAYERMIAAVKAGEIDVVIVLRTDRLYRRLKELIELTDVLRETPVYSVHSGDVDLSTADGRMMANVLGSMAQHESEVKSERISAASRQRAAKGRYNGGNRRFGYEHASKRTIILHGDDVASEVEVPTGKLVLVPAEADAIKWAYEHVLHGGSLRSVCREWASRGLVGGRGAAFSSLTVRNILLRPMNAGLATYKGEVLEVSHDAPAIVTVKQWQSVKGIIEGRREGAGRPATSLLSPVLKCAVCLEAGNTAAYVNSSVARPRQLQQRGASIYRCKAGGHVQRRRVKLDSLISVIVLVYIVNNADSIRRPLATSTQAVKQERRIADLKDTLAKWSARAGDLHPDDYANAVNPIRAQLTKLEKASVKVSTTPATIELLQGKSDVEALVHVGEEWKRMDVETRRTIITEMVSRIEVGRHRDAIQGNALAGVRIFDRNGVEIEIRAKLTDATLDLATIPDTDDYISAMAASIPAMTDAQAKRISATLASIGDPS